jgi:hypothetical protein
MSTIPKLVPQGRPHSLIEEEVFVCFNPLLFNCFVDINPRVATSSMSGALPMQEQPLHSTLGMGAPHDDVTVHADWLEFASASLFILMQRIMYVS